MSWPKWVILAVLALAVSANLYSLATRERRGDRIAAIFGLVTNVILCWLVVIA